MSALTPKLRHAGRAVKSVAAIMECDFSNGVPVPVDLSKWDVLIARQGLSTPEFHAVAQRARTACHRLFVARDWDPGIDSINFAQRAAPPEVIDDPIASKSEKKAALQAIRATPLFGWLNASLGQEPRLMSGRLRFQPADNVNHARHQDTYFLEGRFFTLWVPAVESGVECNVDAPGLEFLMHRIDHRLDPDRKNASETDSRALAAAVAPEDPDGLFARPPLTLGDALLFREFVPHGGHIPIHATQAKTSFDFRFFVD